MRVTLRTLAFGFLEIICCTDLPNSNAKEGGNNHYSEACEPTNDGKDPHRVGIIEEVSAKSVCDKPEILPQNVAVYFFWLLWVRKLCVTLKVK
jgi:hypothetical protein